MDRDPLNYENQEKFKKLTFISELQSKKNEIDKDKVPEEINENLEKIYLQEWEKKKKFDSSNILLFVSKMKSAERLELYFDDYPFLEFRKKIMKSLK